MRDKFRVARDAECRPLCRQGSGRTRKGCRPSPAHPLTPAAIELSVAGTPFTARELPPIADARKQDSDAIFGMVGHIVYLGSGDVYLFSFKFEAADHRGRA